MGNSSFPDVVPAPPRDGTVIRPAHESDVDAIVASLSDDISNIESVALSVNDNDDELRSELFLAID